MKKLSMHGVIDKFKKFRISRNMKYSSIVLALIAVVAVIALLFNLMAQFATDKLNLKWDLTPNKLFSIGNDTKRILGELDKDVTIYGTFDNGESGALNTFPDAANILKQYSDYPRVKVEYIDLDRTPGFIVSIDPDNLYKIGKNEFIVKCGDKVKKLDAYDIFQIESDYYSQTATGSNAEQAFTGAIMYVSSEITPVIYFSTGHGEPPVESYYSNLKELLERNNYDVKTLNLLTEKEVPTDALVLIYQAPQEDIGSAEKEMLKQYLLERGGRAMFFVDPIMGSEKFAELNSLLSEFNIELISDTIMENDADMYYPMSQYYLVPELQYNDFTASLNPNNFLMLVPGARSVRQLKNAKDYISVTSLLKTSDKADSISTLSEGESTRGFFDLALAAEHTGSAEASKVLVMGNSMFLADEVLGSFGSNGLRFFTAALFWMHDEREEIFIAPKMYETSSINMNATTQSLFNVVLMVVLPLVIFGAGIYVFLRRRHL